MRNQTLSSWPSAELSLLGGMALASLAAAGIWLVLGPAPDVADHLIAIGLLIALFLAALIVLHLVRNTRKQMQAALESRIRPEWRATEALRRSEEQWKAVFEHNPVMYFMVDAEGTVLSVNTFGAAPVGYPVSELHGHPVLKVFFAEDRDLVRKSVEVCLTNIGKTHSWEIRKVRKDGSTIWVRENTKAVRQLDGRLIVLIACEDITVRKQAEDALRQSQSYLAEAQRLESDRQLRLARRHRRNRLVGRDLQNIRSRQGAFCQPRHCPSTHSPRGSGAGATDPRPRPERRPGFRSRISVTDARRLDQTCPCDGACSNGYIRRHRICRSGDGHHGARTGEPESCMRRRRNLRMLRA